MIVALFMCYIGSMPATEDLIGKLHNVIFMKE